MPKRQKKTVAEKLETAKTKIRINKTKYSVGIYGDGIVLENTEGHDIASLPIYLDGNWIGRMNKFCRKHKNQTGMLLFSNTDANIALLTLRIELRNKVEKYYARIYHDKIVVHKVKKYSRKKSGACSMP